MPLHGNHFTLAGKSVAPSKHVRDIWQCTDHASTSLNFHAPSHLEQGGAAVGIVEGAARGTEYRTEIGGVAYRQNHHVAVVFNIPVLDIGIHVGIST